MELRMYKYRIKLFTRLFILIGFALSMSAGAQQVKNVENSQLNTTTRNFLDRLRQGLSNVADENDAASVYNDLFSRSGYANGVFKKLQCTRLEGPEILRNIGEAMVVGAFSKSGKISDESAKNINGDWRNFQTICPSEITYGNVFFDELKVVLKEKASELHARQLVEKNRLQQAADDVAKRNAELKQQRIQIAEQREQEQKKLTDQRKQYQDQRARDLKSGTAKVASLEDAKLLHDARDCFTLVMRPTLGAQSGTCVVQGMISRFNSGGTLILVDIPGTENFFLTSISAGTVFTDNSRNNLRAQQYVVIVGNHIGSESENGGKPVAVFKALYISQR